MSGASTATIAVVGATGTLGRALVPRLLAAGHRVVAVTRRPARAADLAAAGVDVRAGDLADPASLVPVCRDAEVVVACAHGMIGRGRQRSERVDDEGHRALVDTARAAGVRHFVYTSVLGAAADHPADFWRVKHRIEQHLAASGMSHTILRPAAFMELHAHELLGKAVLAGRTVTIPGSGRVPMSFVSARDVAAVAALAIDAPHLRGRTVEIGGPDNPTKLEVVETYARIAGVTPVVRHIAPRTLRIMGAVIGVVHPGVGRLLRMSAQLETVDQRFHDDGTLGALGVSPIALEEFVRERAGRP